MIHRKRRLTALWLAALCLPVLLAAAVLLRPAGGLARASAGASAGAESILIIDAGHGGEDGGAVAPDGTYESDLNLDIALRLDALARFWGVPTRMTRVSAAIDYPASAQTLAAKKKADQNARLALINDTPGGVLLSIHQNIYPAASPNGIQVFFGTEPGGEELAVILQDALTSSLCPQNRRVAEAIDEGIYLMRKAECPAVLVECGFLSNPGELEKLETESYRTELASVMLSSYLHYIRGTTI